MPNFYKNFKMCGLRKAKQCRELRILKNNKILENFKIQRTEKKLITVLKPHVENN